ncbi:MAG: ribosome maturation factor RimM [Pseudomonadota bacterium]|nr:ribosome maturation factor RimM [Pseudomonadota bacterium]
MTLSRKICIGQIMAPHGVKGLVRVRSFAENPEDIGTYAPLTDESGGRVFRLHLQAPVRDHWIVRIEGVADRNAAEALSGQKLYVDRSLLPEPAAGEYYHTDLIGLTVMQEQEGARVGEVVAVHNYGAGDFLEIRLEGRPATEMLPLNSAHVPEIRIREGFLVISPPAGWLDVPEKEEN